MVVSNLLSGSNTLKFDDVISAILREETHRKTLGGSTLGSYLNAQSRRRMIERRNNPKNCGKSRGKSKGKRSQIVGTMGNQGIRRKIVGLERIIKETNKKGTRRKIW